MSSVTSLLGALLDIRRGHGRSPRPTGAAKGRYVGPGRSARKLCPACRWHRSAWLTGTEPTPLPPGYSAATPGRKLTCIVCLGLIPESTVAPNRLAHLLTALGDLPTLVTTPSGLCSACMRVLEVDGVGISLITGGQLHGQLCATDDTVAQLERIQFMVGEGPCGVAFATAGPVLEPNLASAAERWPAFAPEAIELGVRSVFAFPLGPGLAGIGALTLYCNEARDLSAEQLTDGLVLAHLVTEIILAIQLGAPVDELRNHLGSVSNGRAQIHQATGMASAQLDASPADALSRLRAHAWSNHRTLGDVAADVVARRLRFEPEAVGGGD